MKKLKVVIAGPAYPYRGGLSTFNERLAEEFAKSHEVEISTFTLQYPGFLFPGQTQYSAESGPTHIKITRELNSVNPFNWIAKGLKYRKQKPDLIIFRYWMPFFGPCFGTIARIVRGNKHTRIVAITDNIIPHERRIIDKPFTAWFLPSLHGAVAMSRKVLQDLDDLNFKQPHLFNPHPLYDNFGPEIPKQDARQMLGLDPNGKYILFFGFIRHYKGLDLLLQAMGQESLRNQGIKLIVAGEFYEDAAPYHQLIADLGIADLLELRTDFIPNGDVANYFSAADLIVQPYRSATQSGVSQVAYHFNKPMIVTDVGGLAEFVPDGEVGFVTEPTPESIAQGINRFYSAPTDRFDSGIQDMKAKFSWSQLVQSLLEVGNIAG
jgi:glycosyltransferase involved in cell wall biosynthesis